MNIEKLKKYSDQRGDLFPVAFLELPFIPKRLFYIINSPAQTIRGEHGHYKCKQFYICLRGIITVKTFDGIKAETIHLSPGKGLLIENMIWSSETFCFGNDILLVLCSEEYDAQDYFQKSEILIKKS